MLASTEFRFQIMDPTIRGMRRSACSCGPQSALNHEAGNDSVEGSVVIPAGLYQGQEIASGFRGHLRFHPNGDIAETCMEQNVLLEILDSRVFERRDRFRLYPDAEDPNRLQSNLLIVGGRLGNLVDDL